jgi:serine/threonine protein kinase/tetratricopeptide (TPR) repeat protein
MGHTDPAAMENGADGSAVSPTLPKDRRIGKYAILGLLGKGGMGVVYRALDPFLEREVALKVMLPQIAEDPEQKQRFEREARAVAKLNHPNVVMVFDLGYHTDGAPYIVMELLQGDDLLHIAKREPPLRLEQKVAIVLQVLDGLGQAHKLGIVHRDIKPANVFVTDEGTAKIMDFGIARLGAAGATGGTLVGTAAYMSPEQVQGHPVDGRSDLFSVGSMLGELLGGRRPFEAETPMATLYRIAHKEPTLDLPAGPAFERFRPVLGRALAKDPAQRFATSAEFADALVSCVDSPLGVRRKAVLREGSEGASAPPDDRTGPIRPPTPSPADARPVPAAGSPPSARRLDPSGLFRLLRDVYVGGKSGQLHHTSSRGCRSLRIVKGQITHAVSDKVGERLGEVLVRYGVISQGDLERALASGKRLGSVLSGTGLVDRGRLEEALGLHVREILFAMLEGEDGSYAFEELVEETPEGEAASTLSTGQVILEATRRVQDPEMVRRVLGDQGRVLALSSDPLLRFQRITLTPTDGYVLSRVDGTLSARDVISLSPVPPEDTERSLFGLLCTGIIDYGRQETTSRTRPTPVVDWRPRDAETPAGKAAGGASPQTTAPPAPVPPPAPEPSPATHPGASVPETPPAGSEAPGREPADVIREAEGLLAQRRFSEAVERVEPVLSRVEGPLRTRASILLARGYMMEPERRGRAEAVLLDLIREAPDCTPAYFFLGTLYRTDVQLDRARSMYRKVLEIEPDHRGAKAELAALGD